MPTTWLGRAWSWRERVNATLVLLIAAGLVAFLGVAVVGNYQAAGDAVASLDRARTLTSERITKLNQQIADLSAQNAHAQRQRGVLISEVAALTHQLRALGVRPVVTAPAVAPRATSTTVVVVHPTPRPTVTRTKRPPSKPTHHPSPTPTPHPVRSCLAHPVACLGR